ncbi:MAG: fumarylacetoacetate hydrolase family protein [Candidatus Marinimicrobia bacterium]|jgi:2-keto-4-pentenoate hydratase/2-oxohepta-3-ene-1,7-dioic acid hydratase in catechol pathway|nr:fumarylacetoacetate hydrolase family protein [Candidatus Neomarinimicrobiota bacterium]MDP7436833.1 fumarylacetoacetate hydrolase family protein [Candidatus Neomarinimicrobiota bacterium]
MKYKRLFITLLIAISSHLPGSETTKYVRYTHEGQESYGILEGDTVRELVGDIFSDPTPSGKTLKLSEVHLLAPCKPTKVIAVGLNYRSHIGNRPVPEYPGLFAKYPSSIIGQEENIVIPSDATDLHYEGELVVVIGKKAKNISVSKAPNYIFGVTAGNDVSERKWQQADLQWLRAKASDTFGPVGPAIVTGLNYNDLLLQTRLNGEIRQSERTKDLVYDVEAIVSYISHYVTLFPGDLIFTGTPGTTKAMKPNDIVEIELEGVGILRNKVVSPQQ